VADVVDLFCELAAIPSPPGEERAVADRVLAELEALGLTATEDDAGARIGSTMGPLAPFARSSGTNTVEPMLSDATSPTSEPPRAQLKDRFRASICTTLSSTSLAPARDARSAKSMQQSSQE